MFFRTFAKLNTFTQTACAPAECGPRPASALSLHGLRPPDNDLKYGIFENDHTPAAAGRGGPRALLRGERSLFRPAVPRRGAAPARRHAVRRHGQGYQRHARIHGRRSPVDGPHVRRHARLPDQRGLPGAARQEHPRPGRQDHRHPRRLPLFRHDGHVAHAADLRRQSVGGRRRVAGLRTFDLFPAHHRRRPHHQDVGAGLRPADDGRRVDDPAGQHVGRKRAHGAHGVARNRRQPPADHLLFPAGDGRLLDQRRRHGLPGEAFPEFRAPHRRARRRGPAGRRLELLAPLVHGQTLQGDHARRLRAGFDRRNVQKRTGPRLRHGVELRPHGESQPAGSRLHGPRIGHGLRPRRRSGRRAQRLRTAGRRAAAARLLGNAALYRRSDLPRRRGDLPRRTGRRAGPGPQQVVDRSGLGADAPAGMGPQPDVVHRAGLRLAPRLQ